MTVRAPLVLVSGIPAELPAGDSITGGGALTSVEVNLGVPRMAGRFTIAGAGLTVGKPVHILQAVGPYTGKGTRADEAEMDGLTVSASITAATVITAYWRSATRVARNFKFTYFIGA